MEQGKTICFLLLPYVHLLDLAGPVQVFYEASNLGSIPYKIAYCAAGKQVTSEQGLSFKDVQDFSMIKLKPGDFIFVPGIDFKTFQSGKQNREIKTIKHWLHDQLKAGVRIASVCSGSLVLAEAGILNGRKCTTHWKCIDYMQEHYPNINVYSDRLYVQDGTIYTSAGMSSGIDMALSILESDHGPVLPAKVAREIVVYLRRNHSDTQQTIYLDYRTHFNPSIHRVQDYIISNPAKNPSLEELAAVGNISVRNLTRTFKKATGHTIIEFKNAVKVELASTLVHNKEYTLEKIAGLCGFQSMRHFRRIWNERAGNTLKEHRRTAQATA
jgi:transcriptional regulator GlxA family with amidase domain